MKSASCFTAQLHRLSLTVIFSFLGIFSVIGCQISCKSNVQVSLDQNGEALLTPSLFLSNASDCTGPFVVTITANASVVTDNTLRCAQVGQNIIAQVTDSDSQVSCWSTVSVADYNPPKFVNCADIYVPCYTTATIDEISTVTVQDNCDPTPIVTFLDSETTFGCDTYSKIITRTWNAEDNQGLQATPCVQNIYFETVTLAEISIPDNYTFNDCMNPDITPEVTGYPTADDNEIAGAHCGLIIQHADESFSSCGNTFKIFRTWTIYDWCGNLPLIETQTIELIDDTPPVIECPMDTIVFNSNAQHYCTGDASALNLQVTDDCGTATIDYDWEYAGNATNVPVGIYSIDATATDECNNQSECAFFIEIKDTNAPIAICDSDFSVSLSNEGTAVITAIDFDNGSFDNCFIADTLIAIDSTFANFVQVSCEDIGNTLAMTLMVVDGCGNSTMCSSNVTVEDNSVPTVICPPDITLLCSANITDLTITGNATATDNCFEYTPTYLDTNDLTICNTGTITRTWSVVENGIEINCDQIITLVGITPTIIFPADTTVSCGTFAGEPIVDYDCPGLFIGSNDVVNLDEGCNKITTKTWKVFNFCTEEIWEQDQIVTEIDDLSPTFTTPAQDIFVECDISSPENAFNDWLSNNGNSVAIDNCTSLTWSNSIVSTFDDCIETTTVTFTATDECGNSASTVASFNIADTTAPQFSIPPPDTTFSCNVKDLTFLGEYFEAGAASTFEDNCVGTTVTFSLDNPDNIFCGTFPVTIFLTDDCGNVNSSTFMLTITDEEGPIISEEAKDLNVSCDADLATEIDAWLAINGSAVAFDRCVAVEWSNDYNPAELMCGTEEGLPVTFFATDQCGNNTPTIANIFIIDDEAPQFTTLPQDITINCTSDLQGAVDTYLTNGNGATFSDNCGTPTLLGALDGEIGSGCSTTNVIFTLIDDCNNSITTNRQITIIDDTSPVITQAPQDQMIECVEEDIQSNLQAWLNANGNAIATDDCGEVFWTNNYDGLIPTCDGNSAAQVTFTATDLCGNSTNVVGNFMIEDTTPPVISFEASDAIVECDGNGNEDDLQNWLLSNGGASASDECGEVEWFNDFSELQDGCGATGATIVTFTAIDPCGNQATTMATFTIIDTTPPEFLAPPMDYVTECDGNGNLAEFDVWTNNFGGGFAQDACGTIVTTFDLSSTILNCEEGESKTVTVLFVAIDDCGNSTTALANFITNDTSAPTVICPDDIQEVDLNTDCENDVIIEDVNASDFCSDNINFTFEIDYDQDGTVDVAEATGQNATGTYPVGRHFVNYYAEDECGNVGTCQQVIDIIDIVSPQIECNDFVIYLDENGEYIVDANIVGNASDNCSEEVTATANLELVTCDNQPTVMLMLEVLDDYGNPSSCTKIYAVVDTFGVCNGPQSEMAMISGNLYREDFQELENATVTLSDGLSNTVHTNNNGEYNFNVNPGNNYTITPFKNDDPKNGVSTIDLITLQQHILGAIPIVSPYQLIAADANNSGTISTLDLVEIQQLILDIIPEFTNNTSWRFVDQSFVFPSPANPFASYFPEETAFNNLSGVSLDNDFIAIKIGDLNGSSTTNNLGINTVNRNINPTYLFAKNKVVAKEEVVEIPLAFNQEQRIDGYQLKLQFDTDVFEFLEITDLQLPNLTTDNFGFKNLDNGVINTNWINNNQHTITANQSLFTIRLRAKVPTNLKDVMTIDPLSTYNEIYKKNKDGVLSGAPLHLTFEENIAIPITGKDQVFLYQNAPNPFEDRTTIQFNLPKLTKSTVSIFDATGRLVWQVSKDFPAGENRVTIESRDLGLEGVYIYTLDTDYGREVKKMILLSKF